MMKVENLISCMHQKDTSIAFRSNIKSDCIIVNQCDINTISEHAYTNEANELHCVKVISTTERGLSRSRNMAIKNATGDICIIMDDDEILEKDYVETVTKAYIDYPDADVIAFKVRNSEKNYASKPKKLNRLGVLKVASYEITFKRQSIIDKQISFDVEMGSGTGHGGGEENAFLYSCLKKGLKIRYVPQYISSLNPNSGSQWFKGFTPRFFLDRGWATARYMGKPLAVLYAIYYVVRKHNMYSADCSFKKALTQTIKGIFTKTLP